MATTRGKAEETALVAYKAFEPDLSCRGFQFEVGKGYAIEADPKICERGFHACEHPFDVFDYYPLGSRVARVTLSGKLDRQQGDSKVCGASITIDAELTIPEFVKDAVAWIVKAAKGNVATGDRGHAAATGDRGHAAATGYSGHAAATGYRGHAAATGYSGHAAATGDRGHAAATGDRGHAAATGDRGHAAATGYSGHAAATGDSGHAAATGYSGHAAATGDSGHAAATGYRGHAAATGDSGHAAATGEYGIAASLGPDGCATAGTTGYIVLAHWNTTAWPYTLTRVERFKVGKSGVEAGKTYRLSKDGKPVEVSA
jgi:hypothetical protein